MTCATCGLTASTAHASEGVSAMRDRACFECKKECAVGLQIIWKDMRGKWQQRRYCVGCAKRNGDLE